MRKILIISYYWPPSGGSGVQRWLNFSKYLTLLGFDITVLIPDNPNYPIVDNSLANSIHPSIKVIRSSIFEPNAFFK